MYIFDMDKIYEIYLVVIPGLEKSALLEIKEKLCRIEAFQEISNDGLSLKSKNLFILLEFILELRIPTKALLRIDYFIARDLPKLYKKLSKINWNDYIPTKEFEVKVSSHNSRLFDDRKIIKTVKDAISSYQTAQPYKKKYDELNWSVPATIHLRFEEDNCSLSIDCSGERLDKRGIKTLSAKAPMRESIGAALIRYINSSDVNYDVLIDPMAGSGTIISEFFRQDQRNEQREFNFRNFPLYRKFAAQKIERPQVTPRKAFARDIDGKNLAAIKENNLEFIENEWLTIEKMDFFKSESLPENSIITCNLPYGKRIKTKEKDIHLFIERFLKKAESLNTKAAFFVMPETFKINQKKYQVTRSERINNGGIWVQFIKVLF
ncbi:hypothetical protein DAY19_11090 [Halobacteriovorax vibrionivorans]|uniref:Uncharacterized protein n=2 Tax=Halobacteriovoraceae TaxID=1652132 RepID=A0ABY0IDB5_9BACT|nr:hypothetical protein DAY19_11090 [Halobacteriovorax vibrionivorans]TGD47437.1 hypothetical protein EP118_07620 [Halobacteriovorax sp. Y22]